jgi:hypothetical protein
MLSLQACLHLHHHHHALPRGSLLYVAWSAGTSMCSMLGRTQHPALPCLARRPLSDQAAAVLCCLMLWLPGCRGCRGPAAVHVRHGAEQHQPVAVRGAPLSLPSRVCCRSPSGRFITANSPVTRLRRTSTDVTRTHEPASKAPVQIISGAAGIVQHKVLGDRRHVLTKDSSGEVSAAAVLPRVAGS